MPENPISVTVEKAFDRKKADALLFKFSSKYFEVNVHMEIKRLVHFLSFLKGSNDVCLAGESAKDSVYWVRESDGSISLLIGHDLDAWDIGILIDTYVIAYLLSEIYAIFPVLRT